MRRALSIVAVAMIVGCGFSVGDGEIGGDDGLAAPERRVPDRADETDSGSTTTSDDPSLPGASTDGGTIPDASDGAPVSSGPFKAFVTSSIVTGNLGGVAGADKLCNDLAKAQGLAGMYVAWISTAQTNAIDRVTAPGPWLRVDGQQVAKDKAQLATGNLTNPLRRDEKNQEPPIAEDRVWTATSAQGTFVGGSDCGAWTGAGNGRVGEAEHANGNWTNLVDEACTEVNRVYCFQNQ